MVEFLNKDEQLALEQVCTISAKLHSSVWVVGGVIRDVLLGTTQRLADVDLVIEGDCAALVERIASEFQAEWKYFPDFHTAKVLKIPAIDTLDFASTRKEQYSMPGALPDVELGTLEEDSSRRDISINALYVKLQDFISIPASQLRTRVCDRVGGMPDLDAKIVRVLHKNSFIDDPTRLFRSLRYLTKIEGTFEVHTAALFEEAVTKESLMTISRQRIWTELLRASEEQIWHRVMQAYCKYQLLVGAELLDPGQEDFFIEIIDKAKKIIQQQDSSEFFTAVLYFLTASENRESRFRKYGYGKKFFNRMEELAQEKISSGDSLTFFLKSCFESAGLKLK